MTRLFVVVPTQLRSFNNSLPEFLTRRQADAIIQSDAGLPACTKYFTDTVLAREQVWIALFARCPTSREDKMAKGKVKWFSDSKGYGFIQTEEQLNGGKDIFVHYSEIVKDGYKSLFQGQAVEFELSETPKGLQAKNVEPLA